MPDTLYQHEDNTLKRVEEQINILTGILDHGRSKLRFPRRLEQRYLDQRNQSFLDIDRKMLVAGLLFYMAFSWTDFYLGGDKGAAIFMARSIITAVGLFFIWWAPKTFLYDYVIICAAIGVFVAGLSVLVFIGLIPGELKYAYHLGMVPIQVFIIVALRLSYRLMLSVSIALLLIYLIAYPFMNHSIEQPELRRLIDIFIPVFVLFWLLLIMMGGYIAFMMESAARSDFVKNQLLALEAQRLQHLTTRLHYMSTTDSLTGIANRRHFEKKLESEWRRCLRSKTPLALVMIDLDQFKEYNDHYGHLKGDECLKLLAQLMSSFCQRPGDLCARYGGEEFVILLPDTPLTDALRLIEDMRAAVGERNIPHQWAVSGHVTISAGVAAEIPQEDRGADALLSEADRRLYQAKDAGRNQVAG
ncbi:MAG: hypothetical protein CMI02_05870 [Oceanospirillaceae bacterium]|nr:hypothetical protein [Oceanospirillaceae bacterium]MBT11544.1 hypothetical protein [Oceanospirillaceae bacterium]